jgi:hypothetical protein
MGNYIEKREIFVELVDSKTVLRVWLTR